MRNFGPPLNLAVWRGNRQEDEYEVVLGVVEKIAYTGQYQYLN